jgi:hypothetical protein
LAIDGSAIADRQSIIDNRRNDSSIRRSMNVQSIADLSTADQRLPIADYR